MNKNPYTIKIPYCAGKRYVIPDTHGCLSTFKSLFEKIELSKTDQLFLLGDYVDRGPSSVELVDFIIQLKDDGFQIFPLLGNHEMELILTEEYKTKWFVITQIKEESMLDFFDNDYRLKAKYLEFLISLPYYIELEDFIMVHAGFDFLCLKPFEDEDSMLEIRNWPYNNAFAKGKTIIFGHNPTHLDDIKQNIESKNKTIPLDNGCVYKHFEGLGNLLCLCLDDFQLTIQPNIELF